MAQHLHWIRAMTISWNRDNTSKPGRKGSAFVINHASSRQNTKLHKISKIHKSHIQHTTHTRTQRRRQNRDNMIKFKSYCLLFILYGTEAVSLNKSAINNDRHQVWTRMRSVWLICCREWPHKINFILVCHSPAWLNGMLSFASHIMRCPPSTIMLVLLSL